jgi:hypothetical protein
MVLRATILYPPSAGKVSRPHNETEAEAPATVDSGTSTLAVLSSGPTRGSCGCRLRSSWSRCDAAGRRSWARAPHCST